MPAPGKFVVPDGATTGDVFTILAPTAPSFIEVLELQLTVSATSTVKILSGTTLIDKAFLGTGNRYEKNREHGPPLTCAPGEAFVINNSAGTIAGGGVYRVVGVNAPTDWANQFGS